MLEQRQDLNEKQLLQRICAGEQAAFQHLMELYHHLVWHTICVLMSGRSSAEDTLQEVWIDIWRGLPGFQHERAFRPWLLTVASNRCRKNIRRALPVSQPLDMLEPEQFIASDDVLEQWLNQETAREIRDLVMELPAEQQRVLELRYFAELDLSEIAVVMETSVGTVKSRLHRALHRLRMQLQSVSPMQSFY